MKKILCLVAIVMMAVAAKAQITEGMRMGARANIGLTNLTADDTKAGFGYGIDWVVENNITSNLYVQSGLGFQSYNFKIDSVDGNVNATFLQLPIHVGGRYNLNDAAALFVQGGPTLACGIFGSDFYGSGGGKVGYFDSFRRFDLGLGARAGIEFNKLKVSAGVNYGLIKAAKNLDAHNLTVNLGVAYMFWSK